jgi:2-polyprenyl-6-methoxyphenol hydroxylase-like FAD-dependent oxidoreductase
MTSNRTALVVGGGIGGLAAAISLQQAGFHVKVVEKVSVLREVGAGITLWGNAQKALRHLGLGEHLEEISMVGSGAVWTNQGEQISNITPADANKWLGGAVAGFHRAELHAMLIEKAGGNEVLETGRHCIGFEQDERGVAAQFSEGGMLRADVLVGADGIQSIIRQQLFGKEPLRYAGYTAWRGTVTFPHDQLDGLWGEYWGRGTRFGMVPLTNNRVYWFVTKNAPEGQDDGPFGRKQEVLEYAREYPAYSRALIEATPEHMILRNDIHDRKPLQRWSVGRVTLLGDAAHATTPNLGQGACQAIEDAVVLGRVLKGTVDVSAALREYEKIRIQRANSVIVDSRRIGAVGQWENSAACWLRNQIFRRMPRRILLRQIAKYAAYEV